MERRDFVKLGLLSSTAIVLPLGCTTPIGEDYLSGGERLFLSAEDIKQIAKKCKKYDWAKKRLAALRAEAIGTEEMYWQSHWKGTWREWTTGQYLKSVALYYRLTGEEKNLFFVKEALIKEFKLESVEIPLYKADKEVSSSMWSYGVSRMNYLWSWDLLKNHPDFAAIKPAMESRLEEMTKQYFRYENEKITRLGNTQFWGITTLGILGFLTSNQKAIDTSINGRFGFKAALESKMRDGKFWPEPLSYTLDYVLCAMSLLAEAARMNDYEDLYAYVSPSGNSLKSLIDGLFELCNPNGLLVANGDGSYACQLDKDNNVKMHQGFGAFLFGANKDRMANKFEIFYKAYKDPKYAWIINMEKERYGADVTVWGDTTLIHGVPLEGEAIPDFKSAKFQGLGHALLATVEGKAYWQGTGNALHVRNGCTIQYHGHDDPFHIDLFANGKILYPDWYLKNWDYLAPRKSRGSRNKTPLSHYALGHNTVLVDKKGPDKRRYQLPQRIQEFNDITFSEIKHSGRMKSISLAGTIYAGVHQQRTLGITDDYLVDVFECKSEELHTYDYILHEEGELLFESPISMTPYDQFEADYRLAPLDSQAVSADNKRMRDGTRGKIEGAWNALFSDNEGERVRVHFAGEAETEVFESNTPIYVEKEGWDATPEKVRKISKPMLIVRRKCKETKFVVVHQLRHFDKTFEVNVKNEIIHIKTDRVSENVRFDGTHLIIS